ncbi:hypothetical protein JXA85_02030 [Candidatus Woesearchaeota archaeon]|nr:hypothetical protein [Candidatus Woesearchaeota archaeon]
MTKTGAFCEIYGTNIRNRVLEHLMIKQDLDFAFGDMAKGIGISRPKAYEVIEEFEKNNYINKSRVVGKTQLYILNKQSKIVKLFLDNFKHCLKLVAEENQEKGTRTAFSNSGTGTISARNS